MLSSRRQTKLGVAVVLRLEKRACDQKVANLNPQNGWENLGRESERVMFSNAPKYGT